MCRAIWKETWFQLGALLLVVVAVLSVLASPRPKLPGSFGRLAAEVRVGMSRDEVVALFLTHRGNVAGEPYFRGHTRDGQRFKGCCPLELRDLPADQIAWAELDFDGDNGRELFITLGPGGVVTGLRLESDSIWEELRYSFRVARDGAEDRESRAVISRFGRCGRICDSRRPQHLVST